MLTRVLSAAVLVVAVADSSGASDASLNDYVLTSWTTKDGLPSDVIWSLAQDREGYLWLGTNGGLVRFDGVQFTTVESVGGAALPRAPVRTVHVARDGRVWVGFSEFGGVSVVSSLAVQNYAEAEGLPRAIVTALADDAQGRVWAGTQRGLYVRTGDRWASAAMPADLRDLRVDSLFVDRAGSLLVGTSVGIFRQHPGTLEFARVDAVTDVTPTFRGFGEDHAGHVWVTDPLVGVRRLGESMPASAVASRGRGNRLLFDRDGRLWVATMGEGLWRMRIDAACRVSDIEKTRVSGARALFEDRDGNIWAGAGDGLIRLRRPRVMPITDLGLVEAVATSADGTVWAATADGLIPFRSNVRDSRVAPPEAAQTRVRATCADEGRVWVVTDHGILRLGATPARFTTRGASTTLGRINAIAPRAEGGLWVSDRERGLMRWDPRHPDAFEPVAALGAIRLRSLFPDRRGGVWFLSTGGRLGLLEAGGAVRYFGQQEGLGSGPFLSVFEDSQHVVWAGSFAGLSRLDGQRFVPFSRTAGFRGGVSSILEDAEHDLWLATASGIVCLRREEVDRTIADPSHVAEVGVFDAADGFAGMPISFGGPSTALATDGRLWFVTGRGLTSLDPRVLKRRDRPVEVKIERVLIDEITWPGVGDATLPARTSRVAIDYTALDLTAPMRIRFRYRLEGFDADWIDAGTRRQALYTHLPPRAYTFRVAATSADGSWREASTTWAFTVTPMFYQTTWFAASCAIATVLTAWSVWQLRVRRIRRQFALLIGERVRLSRELHDTLLQSLVGVALQFDAVSSGLDPASPAAQQLVRMRKQVEEYIRETRQSIWNLRTPRLDARDLATAIRESAQRAAAGVPIDLEFTECGGPSRPSVLANEPLLKICHEAVRNAARHARARRVTVELRYDSDAVVLRVADDGRGFDPAGNGCGEASGHYGLVSMRERAEQAGGEFVLHTGSQTGTVIEARLPTRADT